MSMRHLETEFRRTGDPHDLKRAEIVASWRKERGSDIPFPSVVTTVAQPEAKVFFKDQLILPHKELPQKVSDILRRAEKTGIRVFEPYHLSGVTLQQDSNVKGWDRKPESWYWEQIKNGNVSQDAPKLPGVWVLVDKTTRPNYKDGKQLHKNDPFSPLLARLRKEGKIQTIKDIPETSRFAISPDELAQVVLPEIARLLGVEFSQVRLPKEIEFNVIGNFKHPEWGEVNTGEWFNDRFGGGVRLLGGDSGHGGLSHVLCLWSGHRHGLIGFRPLVVVSPEA